MKCVVRNNSGVSITLPPVFGSLTLVSGASSPTLVYANMPSGDLASLLALARTVPGAPVDLAFPLNSITFPGNFSGAGVPAGLPVTPSNTYAINGQEPEGQAVGALVRSIDEDLKQRELVAILPGSVTYDLWVTAGDDYVAPTSLSAKNLRSTGVSSYPISKQRMVMLGGDDDVFGDSFISTVDNTRVYTYNLANNSWTESPPAISKSGTTDADDAQYFGGQYTWTGPAANGNFLLWGGFGSLFNSQFGVPGVKNRACYMFNNNSWVKVGDIPVNGVMDAGFTNRGLLLQNGKTVAAGPSSADAPLLPNGDIAFLPQAQIFTRNAGAPASSSWDYTKLIAGPFTVTKPAQAHHYGSSIVMPDGRVLLVGGGIGINPTRPDLFVFTYPKPDILSGNVGMVEMFDPATGIWSVLPDMPSIPEEDGLFAGTTSAGNRSQATLTLLPDGRILVAGGGCNPRNVGGDWLQEGNADPAAAASPYSLGAQYARKSCLIFDPALIGQPGGPWSRTGDLTDARYQHAAGTLDDGTALVRQGVTNIPGFSSISFGEGLASTEVYDAMTGAWTQGASTPLVSFGPGIAGEWLLSMFSIIPAPAPLVNLNGVLVASGGTFDLLTGDFPAKRVPTYVTGLHVRPPARSNVRVNNRPSRPRLQNIPYKTV